MTTLIKITVKPILYYASNTIIKKLMYQYVMLNSIKSENYT